MRRAAPLFGLLLAGSSILAAACGKKEPPAGPPPAGYTRYSTAKPELSLNAPESWKTLERQGGAQLVSFFGPVAGKRPFSQSLSLYFHPSQGEFASVEEYARAQKLAGTRKTTLEERDWKGRRMVELVSTRESRRKLHASGTELRRDRMALIPSDGGFFIMLVSSPDSERQAADELFSQALESLRLPK